MMMLGPRVRTLAAGLALAFMGIAEARAQSGQLVPTSTGQPDPKVLSLREMTVDVGIARGYARVNVRQVFENHTGAIQEGTYRFALPPSAAVGDFAVWDGLQRIPGVILEKQRARAIYRDLTVQRIDPGLLQQGEEEGGGAPGETQPSARPSGGALFSVSVAPIPPHATKRLEIQFQQEVPFIRSQGEFRLGLKPADGEPPVADSLTIRVTLEDGAVASSPADTGPATGGFPIEARGRDLVFSGKKTTLNRDLVVRFGSKDETPLRLTAFRNPEGSLPDGLALAPWERPSEIPPEKDGFFLLEMLPPDVARPTKGEPGAQAQAGGRPPVTLAILFDTSLSQRFAGLETAYASLVRLLHSLTPQDRFVLVPFDRTPAAEGAAVREATPAAVDAALTALRSRPLGAGTDLPRALAAGRGLVGDGGRLVLLTDGFGVVASKVLAAARGPLPLFTFVSGVEVPEALTSASAAVLGPAVAQVEADLFLESVLAPARKADAPAKRKSEPPPFTVKGGEPGLRDVYPVLLQPPAPGSLSGWVGRYTAPASGLRWDVTTSLLPSARSSLVAPLPDRALEARDLPRRWARARVDELLRRIEEEGERREWVEEIIALSKRYKFVTPYTAFLAAPRSLLRPRRIQPGDPVLRVECDPGIESAVALFPFGLRLALVRRPATNLWEGRFLVPEGQKDGRYVVRILLRDRSGARITESKTFVLDGRAPEILPEPLPAARPGDPVRVAVRTDEDVILLSARLGDGPPVPLRWDAASKRSVGTLRVPAEFSGRAELFFEAMDAAKNLGFARALLEVRP